MSTIQQTIATLQRKRNEEDGFTLIELLVVIVILGILSGVVVYSVGAINNRGETAACKASVKSLEVAVESYKANTNLAYPADKAALATALVPGYLRSMPADAQYSYTAAGAVTPNC